MSINDITNAAAAMNALKLRYESFLDGADDQIGARQAAYDALAGNLEGIVDDKLTHKYYIDNVAGDDTASGTSASPLATIQEAWGRLVPGCTAEIRLRRGDTYQVDRDALRCSLDNGFVSHQLWGDTADPKPVFEHLLANINGASYSSGFAGRGLNLFFLSCSFRVGLDPENLPQTRFSGLFTNTHNSSVTLDDCDIALGDVPMIKTSYGEPVHVAIRGSTITRQAGATGSLIDANSGILRVSTSTPPEGETWADMVSGQIYAADGECRNFVTNVTL